jgi:hypothetical protein
VQRDLVAEHVPAAVAGAVQRDLESAHCTGLAGIVGQV